MKYKVPQNLMLYQLMPHHCYILQYDKMCGTNLINLYLYISMTKYTFERSW